ncbi:MAG: hypothetical protein ACREQD_03785 [Candidatus Binataceae bacterium]
MLQQPVDQRGFAMVDVGDDGDVAKIHYLCRYLFGKTNRGPLGPRIRAEYSDQMLQRNRPLEPFQPRAVIVVNAARG